MNEPVSDLLGVVQIPAYSPFRRGERDLMINEEDALLLKGESVSLIILVEIEIEDEGKASRCL